MVSKLQVLRQSARVSEMCQDEFCINECLLLDAVSDARELVRKVRTASLGRVEVRLDGHRDAATARREIAGDWSGAVVSSGEGRTGRCDRGDAGAAKSACEKCLTQKTVRQS